MPDNLLYKKLVERTQEEIEWQWPNLKKGRYEITSPATRSYNCIAWTKDEKLKKWLWPLKGHIWPKELPLIETIENFIKAFELDGYELCDNGLLEFGYEKVVIYSKENEPTHMARQLPTGKWTSKLGGFEDIIHNTWTELEGDFYGKACQFLKRKRIDLIN